MIDDKTLPPIERRVVRRDLLEVATGHDTGDGSRLWIVEPRDNIFNPEKFSNEFIDADQYEREQRDKVIRELIQKYRAEGNAGNPMAFYVSAKLVDDLRELRKEST